MRVLLAAAEFVEALAEQSGAALDRIGRITLNSDLTLPGHPEARIAPVCEPVRGTRGL